MFECQGVRILVSALFDDVDSDWLTTGLLKPDHHLGLANI